MSQEKKSRNKDIYKDRLKDMSYRKLQEKWGLSVGVLRTIIEREYRRESARLNMPVRGVDE